MARRPTEQPSHSWAIYRLTSTPAKFVGIVYDVADAEGAIKQAIKQFKVRPNERGRLIAQRRD
jgi:hypothetical protein